MRYNFERFAQANIAYTRPHLKLGDYYRHHYYILIKYQLIENLLAVIKFSIVGLFCHVRISWTEIIIFFREKLV